MKKINTLLFVFILILTTHTSAKVWTVNNYHGAADFTTLQAAINGASDGDTIYIEGSATSYGSGTLNKKLAIIGTGYWLEENDTTQAYKESSTISGLTFNAGSENSVVMGLKIFRSGWNFNMITINTDSIIVKRNFINASSSYTNVVKCILLVSDKSNIIIEQNWIYLSGYYSNSNYAIYVSGGVQSNIVIRNNFIQGKYSNSKILFTSNTSSNDINILNNVMWGSITTYYTEHTNNILVSGSYNNGLGDGTFNNICNGTQYPAVNSNQQNVDMSTVFVDYALYIDKGYILAAGSPAIAAGANGGDCGVFSGDTGGLPYVLSGMPGIPVVFEATIPNKGVNTIPVNIKAISHN